MDTSRKAGGGGFPAPLLPPQLKDAEPGWGRGAHADLSSASSEGRPGAAEVEFSRVGVEGSMLASGR